MKDILIAFPQYKGGGHDSMSAYYSTVRDELKNLDWNVLEAIPQNYEKILKTYSDKYSLVRRATFSFIRITRLWILEYWAFLFFISLNKTKTPLLAISQEYAPVFYKKRSIVIVHDMIQAEHPRSKQAEILYKYIIPWSLRKCAAVISVSKTTQATLLNYGITSSVVYNHIDLDKQDNKQRHLYTKEAPSTALWIGTAASHKSLGTLLHAAAHFPKLTFHIVLPERDVSLIPHPPLNVNLHTNLSNNELRDFYLNTDIFISTSLDEGYGRPAMEARILGCKLVLSDLPIYRELHNGAACFFVPGDSSALITTLNVLITDNNSVFESDLSILVATKDELAKKVSNLATKIF